MYRGLHRLTKISSKISAIKIKPYYPAHKDNLHYVITFRVENLTERLAIYIGDTNELTKSALIPVLDTSNTYTILFDETEPAYDGMKVGVQKMVLDGKIIYKDSRLLTLAGGVFCNDHGDIAFAQQTTFKRRSKVHRADRSLKGNTRYTPNYIHLSRV